MPAPGDGTKTTGNESQRIIGYPKDPPPGGFGAPAGSDVGPRPSATEGAKPVPSGEPALHSTPTTAQTSQDMAHDVAGVELVPLLGGVAVLLLLLVGVQAAFFWVQRRALSEQADLLQSIQSKLEKTNEGVNELRNKLLPPLGSSWNTRPARGADTPDLTAIRNEIAELKDGLSSLRRAVTELPSRLSVVSSHTSTAPTASAARDASSRDIAASSPPAGWLRPGADGVRSTNEASRGGTRSSDPDVDESGWLRTAASVGPSPSESSRAGTRNPEPPFGGLGPPKGGFGAGLSTASPALERSADPFPELLKQVAEAYNQANAHGFDRERFRSLVARLPGHEGTESVETLIHVRFRDRSRNLVAFLPGDRFAAPYREYYEVRGPADRMATIDQISQCASQLDDRFAPGVLHASVKDG